MLQQDHFSRWLGLEIDEYSDGRCALHFTVREDMLNGFGTIHGGVLFAAADSAFAFACNSKGLLSVALDAHISFHQPAVTGDVLYISASRKHEGHKTGFYDVKVEHADGRLIASFYGTSYITGKAIV